MQDCKLEYLRILCFAEIYMTVSNYNDAWLWCSLTDSKPMPDKLVYREKYAVNGIIALALYCSFSHKICRVFLLYGAFVWVRQLQQQYFQAYVNDLLIIKVETAFLC